MAGKTNRGKMTGKQNGWDLPGVTAVSDFLREARTNRKVKGDTIVIGGGSVAMSAACEAMRCGSEKVTVVCLEKTEEVPALPEEVAEAKAAGVRIIHGWAPVRAEAHPRDGKVSGVHFKHCDRVYDGEGRFAPVYDESNVMAQYADTVILANEHPIG